MKSEIAGGDSPVAIIGGGFSGTMAAANLARRGVASILIEGGGKLARGTAFSTTEPAHLLNVKASAMSAWPDEPEDFSKIVEAEGGSADDFVERRRFGRYLGRIFDEAVSTGLVKPIAERAMQASRKSEEWIIELQGGSRIAARALVLAQGNQTPEPMAVAAGIAETRFITDPWGAGAQRAVGRLAESGRAALILGTGLTMIDMVLSLDAAGHRGRIIALSRRGQIPRSHLPFDPAPVEEDDVPKGDLLGLWRWLRQRSGAVGWRAAVDSLRPHSQLLWRALSLEQQRRFLRHARPWWDVHRHRIAPQVARRIAELVAEGRLEIVAGRVAALAEDETGLGVTIDRRRGKHETVHVEIAFNCTGPLGRMDRTRDPLLRQMIDDGLISIDHLGIGLDVDAKSRAGDRIWALGPLTKGRNWEIVAVPDIRGQAAAVAADIEAELMHDLQS